jgi:hypothetical protein
LGSHKSCLAITNRGWPEMNQVQHPLLRGRSCSSRG